MEIHIIVHESYEGPGAILSWAKSRNHNITVTQLHHEDTLPPNAKGIDFLIIMGGPQSPATTIQESPHYDAPAEIALIQDAVKREKLVFGVCLGAQLIGEAMGGKFTHSPEREIGVFPIQLTEAAKSDPLFVDFPKIFLSGHWHGDMPGLTPEAEILATSVGCPRQIIRYAPHVYAFQCHLELRQQEIELLIAASEEYLATHTADPYIKSPTQLRTDQYQDINERLFIFLDRFTRSG